MTTELRKKVRLTTDLMLRRTSIQDIEENVLEMLFRYLVETGCNKNLLRSVCRQWCAVTDTLLQNPPKTLIIPLLRDKETCKREHDMLMCSKLKTTMNLESLAVMDDPVFEERFLNQFEAHLSYINYSFNLLSSTPIGYELGQIWNIDVYGHSVAQTMYKFLHIAMCQKKHRIFDRFVEILGKVKVLNFYDDFRVQDPWMEEYIELMCFAIKEHLHKAFEYLYKSPSREFDIYEILTFIRSCCVGENMTVLECMVKDFQLCSRIHRRQYLKGSLFDESNSQILMDIKKAVNDILSVCKNDNFTSAIRDILSYLEN